MRYWIVTVLVGLSFGSGTAVADANEALPIAVPVQVVDGEVVSGTVIAYDEASDTYRTTATAASRQVYGVVTDRPVMTIVSATTTTPVVTQGVAPVRVTGGEAITRGDLLTTSATAGVATKAGPDEPAVFAVALEAYEPNNGAATILANVGVENARSWQAAKQLAAQTDGTSGTTTPDELRVSVTRVAIAVAVALGAIGFVLFTFRSILTQGMTAIGRNPRARGAVMTMTVGSMVLVVFLALLILLVAVAVLVLPV